MRLKTKLVEKSKNTRQLETISVLEKVLSQVKNYKAIHKLHQLLYNDPDSMGITNPNYIGLAKTEWGYFISNQYNRIEFNFYNLKDLNRDNAISFNIDEKSIPAIIQGLSTYKQLVIEWKYIETKPSISDYRIENEIEKHFSQEMTQEQFYNQRDALAASLRNFAKLVDNLTIKDIDKD